MVSINPAASVMLNLIATFALGLSLFPANDPLRFEESQENCLIREANIDFSVTLKLNVHEHPEFFAFGL